MGVHRGANLVEMLLILLYACPPRLTGKKRQPMDVFNLYLFIHEFIGKVLSRHFSEIKAI